MSFSLTSEFKPTGDQPKAIKSILDSFNTNQNHVTLQGVTGSGKTFTVANVIQEIKKPTLVLAHNKTLAAQLYSEFQSFFPNKNCFLGKNSKSLKLIIELIVNNILTRIKKEMYGFQTSNLTFIRLERGFYRILTNLGHALRW